MRGTSLGPDTHQEARPKKATDMTEIRAIGSPPRKNNAQAIADCVTVGYLAHDSLVADVTYGEGGFWKLWKPSELTFFATDLDEAKSPDGASVDFRDLPYVTGHMDVVVFDPPYKLNGTSTAGSPSDERYGVDQKASVLERHGLMLDGLTECLRVTKPGGLVFAKCQDQVCAGRMQWQSHMMALHGGMQGADLHDSLMVMSYRPQPEGRTQKHIRRDYSTLLIFKKR